MIVAFEAKDLTSFWKSPTNLVNAAQADLDKINLEIAALSKAVPPSWKSILPTLKEQAALKPKLSPMSNERINQILGGAGGGLSSRQRAKMEMDLIKKEIRKLPDQSDEMVLWEKEILDERYNRIEAELRAADDYETNQRQGSFGVGSYGTPTPRGRANRT